MIGPKTLLCYLMSRMEGYGIPGAIPTVRNNPLDLRHSPHSFHYEAFPNDIGWIDTIEHGWQDAERQLQLWAAMGLSLEGMVKMALGIPLNADISTTNPDHNNGVIYLSYLTKGMHMSTSTPVSEALEILYSPLLTTVTAIVHLEQFIAGYKVMYDKVRKDR